MTNHYQPLLRQGQVEGRGIPAQATMNFDAPLNEEDIDHSLAIWTPGPTRPEPATIINLCKSCIRINYRYGISTGLELTNFTNFTTLSALWLIRAYNLLTFSKLSTVELNWPGLLYILKNGKYRWTINKTGKYKYKDVLSSKFGYDFDVMRT